METNAQHQRQHARDDAGRYSTYPRIEGDVMLTDIDTRLAEARALYGDVVSDHYVELSPDVEALLEGLRAVGLYPRLSGGAVRDSFDGTASKDLDFEVYGGSVDDIERVARAFGRVDAVGKKFGVLKMRTAFGEDLDLTVPRRDNKTGVGHTGFSVDMDPTLTVAEASERRDFTMNSMSYDPRLRVCIDYFGGRRDLEDGILRHISPAFAEDPLRVIRGMQFAARFGMWMHPHTVTLAQSLRSEASLLHNSGVSAEWAKWATKSRRPSDGLHVLAKTGWDHEHPGLAAVNDVETRSACDHTHELLMHAKEYTGRFDSRVVLAAVLVRRMDEKDARAFVGRTIEGGKAQRHALALARDVRELPQSASEAREQALAGPSIRERCLLAQGAGDAVHAAAALDRAIEAGVADGPEPELLTGNDVMAAAPGRRPGPWMAEVIERARHEQASRTFGDRDAAVAWLTEALAHQAEAPPS